jgi:L-threonylcarbamoyladenylate synthase
MIHYLNSTNSEHLINQAINYLSSGNLIIAPTDTIYGILGDYFNEAAQKKLVQVKERKPYKQFLVLVGSLSWFSKLSATDIPPALHCYIPGPVTFIVKNKWEHLYGESTLAIRYPHPQNWIANLLTRIDTPLMAPSANVSGQPYTGTIDSLQRQFEYLVSMIVHQGDDSDPRTSSIVDCTQVPYRIVRDERCIFLDKTKEE